MHTFCRLLCVAALGAGCQPADSSSFLPGDVAGRPFDLTQTRVQSTIGDRWDAHFGGPIRGGHKKRPAEDPGDWNYNVGGQVNSGVALYNSAYTGGALVGSCSDRLYVATTGTSNNLWAFDHLYATPPGTTGVTCANTTNDSRCTANSSGFCPTRAWVASLNGGVDRGSLTMSSDGLYIYAATNQGKLYSIEGATGIFTTQTGKKSWSFDARAEIGGTNNAGFVGSAPWANYGDGSIYVAANYTSGTTTKTRLYKLAPTDGHVLAKIDITDGVVSSLIAYDAVYFGSNTGKVYKVLDKGTSFQIASGWPVQLWAETGDRRNLIRDTNPANLAIFGAPAIDADNNLLFIAVNNVFFSININTAAINWVEGGWQSGTEAAANDVSEYSSPWVDPTLMTVFLGHGKNQGNNADGPRCHKRDYNANGTFNTNTLTSVATAGTSTDLTNPRSSPLVLHEPDGSVLVFIGDPQGYLNQWSYGTDFGTQKTFRTASQTNIESPVLIDYLSGNLYFGDDGGRVYQISQLTLK